MTDNGERLAETPLGRAIVAADQILERLGTADDTLCLMVAEVPLDGTELVEDPHVVIPVLRVSRLMGRFTVLSWTHELSYLMSSGDTSRKVFIDKDQDPEPGARIMSYDISVDPDDPDHRERLTPSVNRKVTPREEEIIEHDLTRVANQ